MKLSTESIYKFLTTLGLLASTFSIAYWFNHASQYNTTTYLDLKRQIEFRLDFDNLIDEERKILLTIPDNIYSIEEKSLFFTNSKNKWSKALAGEVLKKYIPNDINSKFKDELGELNKISLLKYKNGLLSSSLQSNIAIKKKNHNILKYLLIPLGIVGGCMFIFGFYKWRKDEKNITNPTTQV